jgi:protein-glutamine gamma-glutamyltransferase
MSAWGHESETISFEGDSREREIGRAASLPLRLAAFFGFAAFASVQYATLILHPPATRVLAVAGIVTAGAGALALCGRLGPRLAALIAACATVATFVFASIAIGIPAALLEPAHWGSLAADLRRGFDGLSGWLWPYRGGRPWARLTVLALLPPAGTAAAAVCFWPSRRREGLRVIVGLAPLVAIFLAGVVNEVAPLWRFQGVVLLALIFAWFTLPTLRPQDANRAVRWLLGCTAAALAVAPLLSSARPWIDYTGWDPVPASTTFQWDQLYGPNTWSRSSTTMLEVAELRPRLLRIATLDRFDGLRFLRSGDPAGSLGLDEPPERHPGQWYERASITVAGLRSSLLLGAGGMPTTLRWLGGAAPVATRQADGTLLAQAPLEGGARYEVLSYDPHPSTGALLSAPRRFPWAYLGYTRFQLPGRRASGLYAPNLRAEARARLAPDAAVGAPAPGRSPASMPEIARRIEASPYAPMFALARRLAAGAGSSYEVARRIETYLRENYTYSLDPPRSRYPLEAFLFSDRRGYCQQFSGAMTLLLRMDGIPARVAVGFQPGEYDRLTQQWRVRALDAHAWVEVYFSGIGWVSFDPTPPASAGEARGTLLSRAVTLGLRGGHGGRARTRAASTAGLTSASRSTGGSDGWLIAALLLAGATGAAIAALWLAGHRRLRRGLERGGAEAITELHAALARLAYDTTSGLTLARLERQLTDADAVGYLRRLRTLRYGDGSERPTPAGRAALRRALAGKGARARLRALLALPPGAARRAPRDAPLSR